MTRDEAFRYAKDRLDQLQKEPSLIEVVIGVYQTGEGDWENKTEAFWAPVKEET